MYDSSVVEVNIIQVTAICTCRMTERLREGREEKNEREKAPR
jgi:hypothetical protein